LIGLSDVASFFQAVYLAWLNNTSLRVKEFELSKKMDAQTRNGFRAKWHFINLWQEIIWNDHFLDENKNKQTEPLVQFLLCLNHTSAPENLSEEPNSPQTKHWCCSYSQFLQKKFGNSYEVKRKKVNYDAKKIQK
jgi:hypothetical protein